MSPKKPAKPSFLGIPIGSSAPTPPPPQPPPPPAPEPLPWTPPAEAKPPPPPVTLESLHKDLQLIKRRLGC